MEQVVSFDQATLEAMVLNMKSIVEAQRSDTEQQQKQRQGLQDKLNDQYLRFVEANNTLVLRMADSGSLVANRTANNAATFDGLIFAGEIDTTAQGAIGAKMSEEFRSVAKQAVEAAVAAVPGTSAASQGTTGVAQGALQTQAPIQLSESLSSLIQTNKALAVELAEIVKALAVLVVKTTGDTVEVK